MGKKKKANPDIKILVDHYHDEFIRVHKFKLETGGMAARVCQGLSESRGLEDGKLLITAYVESDDPFLAKQGWPINLLPGQVNG